MKNKGIRAIIATLILSLSLAASGCGNSELKKQMEEWNELLSYRVDEFNTVETKEDKMEDYFALLEIYGQMQQVEKPNDALNALMDEFEESLETMRVWFVEYYRQELDALTLDDQQMEEASRESLSGLIGQLNSLKQEVNEDGLNVVDDSFHDKIISLQNIYEETIYNMTEQIWNEKLESLIIEDIDDASKDELQQLVDSLNYLSEEIDDELREQYTELFNSLSERINELTNQCSSRIEAIEREEAARAEQERQRQNQTSQQSNQSNNGNNGSQSNSGGNSQQPSSSSAPDMYQDPDGYASWLAGRLGIRNGHWILGDEFKIMDHDTGNVYDMYGNYLYNVLDLGEDGSWFLY